MDWCAVAILGLALAVRLYRLDVPFIDAHSWRQVTNADVARLWTEGPIDFFYPAVSWGGPDGRVGLEFPLLHLLIALAWRAVGVSDVAGRLVPISFSVATVWALYLLGTRLFDRATGRAAAFLLAVSPSVVYFGRTPLSDIPMLAFSVAAVLGYVSYAQTGRPRHALLGVCALALAGLVKLPAVLVLGPVLWTGLVAHGLRRTLADPWYVAAPLGALGAVGLWYLHADQIYLATGLTQAIFRPSGTYPSDIAQWAGPFTTVSHWTRADLLTRQTFTDLADRYWTLHLTPLFAIATAAGMVTWRWPFRRRSIVDVWALASFALVAVSLAGQLPHEFHQLPTLPPLALYFGMAAGPLFSAATYAPLPGFWRVPAKAMVAAALVAAAFVGFTRSGVVRQLYRPDMLNEDLVAAGSAIDLMTPPNALVATVEYARYGTNSPMLLFFARRRGWSFDETSISAVVVQQLREKRGVCYLAVADWGGLASQRPDMIAFLERFPAIELPYAPARYRLVDLGCGAPEARQTAQPR